MKRDWEIIREVLLEIEGLEGAALDEAAYSVERGAQAHKQSRVRHILMLRDAGFLTGIRSDTYAGSSLLSPELTWEGHELLDTIRSKSVWEKIKSTAAERGIGLTVDAVIALGKTIIAGMAA